MSFKFGTSDISYSMNKVHSEQGIHVALGDTALHSGHKTLVQKIMHSVGQTASKVIESGGDIAIALAVWLKDIQQNWLTYMTVAAIILSTMTFLYCTVRSYFARKQSLPISNLLELATVINSKNSTFQQQLSLPSPQPPPPPPSNPLRNTAFTIGDMNV